MSALERLFRRVANWSSTTALLVPRDVAAFAGLLPSDARVLEVGAGASPYAAAFAGRSVVRLDIERRGEIELRADAHAIPFRDGSFGAVFASEVLEHVADPWKVLGEMARVVKPGGSLILTVPFLWGKHEDVDYHRFTDRALHEALARAGCRIEQIRTRGGLFAVMALTVNQVPNQLLDLRARRPITIFFAFVYYLFAAVVVRFLLLLDRLDRRRNFTVGYQVLATRLGAAGP